MLSFFIASRSVMYIFRTFQQKVLVLFNLTFLSEVANLPAGLRAENVARGQRVSKM